ncbi:uncharacterized protein BKA78DRAFT_354717 [Phyllosticta capitalensis]|uniref:uncharacterized protein n=1 Tax=Phyllosticta capitalensis TaxID=121624 RepID=UPI003130339F
MERAIARLQRRRRIWKAEKTPKPSKPSAAAEIQSRLLSLPRELRDQIFEYVLVAGLLQIRPVNVSDRYCPSTISKAPICRRSTFQTESWNYECRKRIELTSSYEIACSRGDEVPTITSLEEPPTVSLLQTCRQIYQEGAEIFYSKNTFYFGARHNEWLIPAALAFFNDRSPQAMKWIKRIKIMIGHEVGAAIGHWSFHRNATWDEVKLFKKVLQEQLPALDDISIIYKGWPVDVLADKNSGEWSLARRFLDAGYGPPEQAATGVGILLLLHDFKRVSIVILAQDGCDDEGRPNQLVAFAALLRSRLLKGGEKLGHSNIVLRHRHYTQQVHHAETGDAVMNRRSDARAFVASCDDDESGRSFLKPATHPSPLWIDLNHWVGKFGSPPIFESLHPESDRYYFWDKASDYCASDNGDTDSLKDIVLEDDNPEPCQLENFTKGRWCKQHIKDQFARDEAYDTFKSGLALQRFWECRCTRHEKCDGGEYCFHKACRLGAKSAS